MPSPGLGGARKLLKAVAEGRLTEQEIDARVDELLEVVLSTTAAIEKAPHKFDEAAHHQLVRRAAAESIVLLKNEDVIHFEIPPLHMCTWDRFSLHNIQPCSLQV